MSQFSGNIIVFHVDYVLLELFQSKHGTLFWGKPCTCLGSTIITLSTLKILTVLGPLGEKFNLFNPLGFESEVTLTMKSPSNSTRP